MPLCVVLSLRLMPFLSQRLLRNVLLLVVLTCAAPSLGAEPLSELDYDVLGQVRAVVDWPREVSLRAGLTVVGPGWNPTVPQYQLAESKRIAHDDGSFDIHGHMDIDGKRIAVEETAGTSVITYRCNASDADVPLTGIFWMANLPIDRFDGGSIRLGEANIPLRKAANPAARELAAIDSDHASIRSADGQITIDLTCDGIRKFRVQDVSSFGDPSFQVYVPLIEGDLKRGQPATIRITCKTTIVTDISPATVTIDANDVQGDFDGFGGNFVYGTDSAVTRTTLDALKLTWARVPLELRDWEPTNDNGDAHLTNIAALKAADLPGSKLRKRFELDRDLFKRTDGRMIASVWYLPEWLFAEPIQGGWRETAGIVPRERWDELAECVASYLTYLRDAYGVEPRLFSFNESDLGVYVKLDGEGMRDLARVLQSRFAKDGLKTKLLLGDSADLAVGLGQIAPTLADAGTRGFVGALAYHPWSGQNDQWAAWATLAEKHALPLYTTEMGAMPNAYLDGSFRTPLYALRLARRYLEQLSTARSQALLEWEWSDDFAMTVTVADGSQKLTPRGEWLRQITQSTPQFAKKLGTTVDRNTVLAATLAKDDAWAVHVVNLDAARAVHVRGLPQNLKTMLLQIVDPQSGPLADQQIEIVDGACDLTLPTAAMATLSTVRP